MFLQIGPHEKMSPPKQLLFINWVKDIYYMGRDRQLPITLIAKTHLTWEKFNLLPIRITCFNSYLLLFIQGLPLTSSHHCLLGSAPLLHSWLLCPLTPGWGMGAVVGPLQLLLLPPPHTFSLLQHGSSPWATVPVRKTCSSAGCALRRLQFTSGAAISPPWFLHGLHGNLCSSTRSTPPPPAMTTICSRWFSLQPKQPFALSSTSFHRGCTAVLTGSCGVASAEPAGTGCVRREAALGLSSERPLQPPPSTMHCPVEWKPKRA